MNLDPKVVDRVVLDCTVILQAIVRCVKSVNIKMGKATPILLTVRHANQVEPVLQVLSLAPRAKLGNFHSSQAHQHVLHVTKLLENTQVALSQAHARRVV